MCIKSIYSELVEEASLNEQSSSLVISGQKETGKGLKPLKSGATCGLRGGASKTVLLMGVNIPLEE